jgi:hypothetical protein
MRWHPDTHGFGFQAELISRLLDEGFSYVEVPVMGQERTKGHAKAITLKNFCSVAHTLLELVIRRLSRKLYGRAGSGAAATRPAEGPPAGG